MVIFVCKMQNPFSFCIFSRNEAASIVGDSAGVFDNYKKILEIQYDIMGLNSYRVLFRSRLVPLRQIQRKNNAGNWSWNLQIANQSGEELMVLREGDGGNYDRSTVNWMCP